MKLASSLWLLALLPTPLAAETVQVGTDRASGNTIISTGGRRTEAVVPLDGTNERVCWFDGQKYSKGARLQVGDGGLVCTRENDYETNGALSWRPANEVPTSNAARSRSISKTGWGVARVQTK